MNSKTLFSVLNCAFFWCCKKTFAIIFYFFFNDQVYDAESGVSPLLSLRLRRGPGWRQHPLACYRQVLREQPTCSGAELRQQFARSLCLGRLQELRRILRHVPGELRYVIKHCWYSLLLLL